MLVDCSLSTEIYFVDIKVNGEWESDATSGKCISLKDHLHRRAVKGRNQKK